MKTKNTKNKRRAGEPGRTAKRSPTASKARATRKAADSVRRDNEPLVQIDRYAINRIATHIAPAAFQVFISDDGDAWMGYPDMAESVLNFAEALYREMRRRGGPELN